MAKAVEIEIDRKCPIQRVPIYWDPPHTSESECALSTRARFPFADSLAFGRLRFPTRIPDAHLSSCKPKRKDALTPSRSPILRFPALNHATLHSRSSRLTQALIGASLTSSHTQTSGKPQTGDTVHKDRIVWSRGTSGQIAMVCGYK